jgi:site-specific recombinase XerD
MSAAIAIIEAPSLPATVVAAEMEAARDFALNEKAEATRRAYRSDFAAFTTWCRARGLVALPAATDTVAAFLAAQATGGAKASSISRRCASIRYAHRLAGHEPPTNAESVKAVMRGIRRTIGTAKEQKAPATAHRITAMLAGVPTDTLTGLRDRALLLLGFAGAFRRSELVGLQVADLADAEGGIRVLIRHSKTDQEGQGQEIAIPHGHSLRPVAAVRAWLEAAGITDGPIFRPVLKGSRVQPEPLSDRSVADIVKKHAKRAGLDPAEYAGHSLRAGYLTSAAEAGANVFKMMEVSRHKSIDTLRGYVRRSDLFRDHSGAGFL